MAFYLLHNYMDFIVQTLVKKDYFSIFVKKNTNIENELSIFTLKGG